MVFSGKHTAFRNLWGIMPAKWLLRLLGAAFFLGLMMVRQPEYPKPWFDEGLFVSMAATLARSGQYALPDSEGPRVLDPSINTGPTVIVPVALAMQLFGIGLVQARLVIVPFTALALVCYTLLAKCLIPNSAVALAVLLLLVGNRELYASFVPLGRQVLGEIPALSYSLLGLLLWLAALNKQRQRRLALVMAGLAWGIASITKLQTALVILGSLAIVALLNHWYYRQTSWCCFVLPSIVAVGCVALWYGAQFIIAGSTLMIPREAELSKSGIQIVFSLNPQHWHNALGVLWYTGWWLWGAPGLAWGVLQARKRTWSSFVQAVALALPLVNLVWFVLLSVGWGRYAFFTFALSPIWTAGLLITLARCVNFEQSLRRVLLLLLVALYMGWNGGALAQGLLSPNDTGYQSMRMALTNLPTDAVVETWDWEMSIDAQRQQHPPTALLFEAISTQMDRRQMPEFHYHGWERKANYLLVGPFATWTGIYRDAITKAQLITNAGAYKLYQLPRLSGESHE